MGLKTRRTIGIACAISIGVIILSLFNYVSVKAKAEKDAYALYSSTIAIVAAEADAWIADFKNMGRAAVISFANAEITPESAFAFLPILRECMQAYGYDDFVIALSDNKTYVSPSKVYVDGRGYVPQYYKAPWYIEAESAGKPIVYGPFFNESANKLQFVVSVPFFDNAGRFAGVAAIFTDFKNLEAVLDGYDTSQLGGSFSIISAKRTIIATPAAAKADIMKKMEEIDTGLEPSLSQINDPLISSIKYNNEGTAKLYFQQGLVGADWYVSFRLDESIALREANRSAMISLMILVISLVSMILLLRVFLRPVAGAKAAVAGDNQQSTGLPRSFTEKYQITAREQQVIEVLILGKTDKEISIVLEPVNIKLHQIS